MKPRRYRGAFARPIASCLLLLGWTIPLTLAAAPHIEDVRIGLRDGKDVARSRNGVWTPVQVTLKAGSEDVTQGAFRLSVETADGEAVPYVYTAPVPAIPANGERDRKSVV